MNQRELNVFLSLAETLHFGRAAESNHMSPSTLTRIIKQLESDVGAPLFERDNRSVTLTNEGKLFRRYARESSSLWESFQDQMRTSGTELKGSLSLYSSVTASYSFLFDLLSQLQEAHPGIRVTLQTGDPERAITRVQSGEAQIGMGSRPANLPGSIEFKTVAKTPLVFIVPRRQPGDRKITRANWQDYPVILPQRGVARDRVTRWLRQKGLTPQVSAQVAGNEAIVSMVSLGGVIGIVPRIVLDNSPIQDRVKILRLDAKLAPLEVGLFALRKQLKSKLVNALWTIPVV